MKVAPLNQMEMGTLVDALHRQSGLTVQNMEHWESVDVFCG